MNQNNPRLLAEAVISKYHLTKNSGRFEDGKGRLFKSDNDLIQYLCHQEEVISEYAATSHAQDELIKQINRQLEDEQTRCVPFSETDVAQEARAKGGILPFELPANLNWLDTKRLVIINRMLFHTYRTQKFYILTGKGGTGKSTYTNLLGQLFDNDKGNLENTMGSTFNLGEIFAKRFVEVADADRDSIRNLYGILKCVATHDINLGDNKLSDKIPYRSQSIVVVCTNNKIEIDLSDSGMLRRTCIFVMNKVVRVKDRDDDLQHKIYSHDELLKVAQAAFGLDEMLGGDDNAKWFESYFADDTYKRIAENDAVYKYLRDNAKMNGISYFDYSIDAKNPVKEYDFQTRCDTLVEWGMADEVEDGYYKLKEELPF